MANGLEKSEFIITLVEIIINLKAPNLGKEYKNERSSS